MIDRVGLSCTGCGACGDICPSSAISFRRNKEGFLYPEIDQKLCVDCGVCEKTCPALTHIEGEESTHSYAAFANHIPEESSSGGLFGTIASWFLLNSGIVYGAAFDSTMNLKHVRVTHVDGLHSLCGSKYVQSDCRGVFKLVKNDLRDRNDVLFVGTPCQVNALKSFLRKEYTNLYTIDLICHGVPSPGVFSDFLGYCSVLRKRQVTGFRFRDNRDGWDNRFRSTLLFKGRREEYDTMLSNLWNRFFFSELAIRVCCADCRFASTIRQGDLTLGDFWGICETHPEMCNKSGVSLVLVNTEKGESLINKVDGLVQKIEAYTNSKEHPNLFHPTKQSLKRSEFMSDYAVKGFEYVVNKYFSYNRFLDIKVRVKSLLSSFFH